MYAIRVESTLGRIPYATGFKRGEKGESCRRFVKVIKADQLDNGGYIYSTIVILPIPSSPATAFALSHEDRVSSLRVNIGQLAIIVIHHHFALIYPTISNTMYISIPDKLYWSR